MTSLCATRLPLPAAGGGPRGRAAILARQRAFNGGDQMFGASGVLMRDPQDTPSSSPEPGIALGILFRHMWQGMQRAIDFNRKPFRADGKIDRQAGYGNLPSYSQSIGAKLSENLPSALFGQARFLSQSARAADVLGWVHMGSVAVSLRIANTAALTPTPLPRPRGGRVSIDECFQ